MLTHELTYVHTLILFLYSIDNSENVLLKNHQIYLKVLGKNRRCYVLRSSSKSSEHSVMLSYDATFSKLLLLSNLLKNI